MKGERKLGDKTKIIKAVSGVKVKVLTSLAADSHNLAILAVCSGTSSSLCFLLNSFTAL